MTGPVDPELIVPLDRLPDSRTFKEMADRTWARLRGRVYPRDFNLAFDLIVQWVAAHGQIGIEQAKWSVHDIFVAMCGVIPVVLIQRCEISGTVMLTIKCQSADGKAAIQRTRTVDVRERGEADNGSGAAAVPLRRKGT